MTTFAFLDGQNLYSGIKSLGWSLDLGKLRVHLRHKYHVTRAFYFIGYMAANEPLYARLRQQGYELVFKEVVQGQRHDPKGNVDAHLVLWAMKELPHYDQTVIVSGDGDYYPLVDYLMGKGKLFAVLAPNRTFCSRLLRRSAKGTLRYVEDIRHLVERGS
jgi:uncharacterized LabA/DUF88 family protein